jgi:death on curing protein
MRYLTLREVLTLHADLIASSGGSGGLRDLGRLQSALAQPMVTFDGVELYADIEAKAGALAFAIIKGHPFIDGNKRIGHAAMEVFLVLNGFEIIASVDEQEAMILAVASSTQTSDSFIEWLQQRVRPTEPA